MVCPNRKSPPRPRDGPWAWFVCFCCFLSNTIIYGQLVAFGVLLPVFMDEFKTTKGVTAWIGSLATGLMFLCGPLSIKIIGLVGERPVAVFSCFSLVALVFASSYANNISILFITYGALYGIFSNGFLCATTKTVQRYFKKHLGIASGIVSCGGSVGTLAISPFVQTLVDYLGWRSALKVVSAEMIIASVACLSFDQNVEGDSISHEKSDSSATSRRSGSRSLYLEVWKSPHYTVTVVSMCLNFLCLFIPLTFVVTFANDQNIPTSKSSLLYVYAGIVSTISRIGIGRVVDKKWITPLQGIQISSYIMGISLISFAFAKEYHHFVLCMLCYGVGGGIFVSTQYTFVLTCFKDPLKSSVGFTTAYTLISLTVFAGSPIAGFIIDIFNSYLPAFYIFGGLIFLSGSLPFLLLFLPKESCDTGEVEQRLELVGSRLANAESTPQLII